MASFVAGRTTSFLVLTLVLSAFFFAYTPSNDQGLFDFNMLESLEHWSFAPSAMDVRPFGLDEPTPRNRSNLYHAFFAVLGTVVDVSPSLLTGFVATPFFGMLSLLALVVFTAGVTRGSVNPFFLLLAVIAPFTLFRPYEPLQQYTNFVAYWYDYRVLNSPTLDKDFSGFFILPMLLFFAWRYLTSGGRRWLGMLFLGIPVCVWTHPGRADLPVHQLRDPRACGGAPRSPGSLLPGHGLWADRRDYLLRRDRSRGYAPVHRGAGELRRAEWNARISAGITTRRGG